MISKWKGAVIKSSVAIGVMAKNLTATVLKLIIAHVLSGYDAVTYNHVYSL